MDSCLSSLTILFEDPFWIGIYERESSCGYEVCKITFGAEPKDYEVFDYLMKNWSNLCFGPALEASVTAEAHVNPKRMQREVQKHLQNTGISTKAQLALSLQREQGKLKHKSRSRETRELEKQRKLELHQEKQKEKHRGH